MVKCAIRWNTTRRAQKRQPLSTSPERQAMKNFWHVRSSMWQQGRAFSFLRHCIGNITNSQQARCSRMWWRGGWKWTTVAICDIWISIRDPIFTAGTSSDKPYVHCSTLKVATPDHTVQLPFPAWKPKPKKQWQTSCPLSHPKVFKSQTAPL